MVVVVWTPRDGGRRIISMRKANESEQKLYGPRLGRPRRRPRPTHSGVGREAGRRALSSRPAARSDPKSIDDDPPRRRYSRGVPRKGSGLADPPQRRIARLARAELTVRQPLGSVVDRGGDCAAPRSKSAIRQPCRIPLSFAGLWAWRMSRSVITVIARREAPWRSRRRGAVRRETDASSRAPDPWRDLRSPRRPAGSSR
jgi:hypothetical protein